MKVSSYRFKAVAVTFGFSLWYFLISSSLGLFSIDSFLIFVIVLFTLTQVLSKKLSNILDLFAIFNTKIFLGILFVTVFTIYGTLFRLLKIDLLRTNNTSETYWLKMEQLDSVRDFKQY